MIPPLIDEVKIIFYLILYGIFLLSTYDIVLFITRRLKKLYRIIGHIAFFIAVVVVTIKFTYSLHHGYIPIIFPIFLLFGGGIYLFLLKKQMVKGLEQLLILWGFLKKPLKKAIVYLFYPQETLRILGYPFRKMKETWRLFFRKTSKETGSD